MNSKKFESTRRYNETAEAYNRRYKDIQTSKYREIFSEISVNQSDLLLDVGGGTGLLLDYLEQHSKNIIVCDLSLEMLKEGKVNNRNGFFVCTDSESLPFRDKCCDLVLYFSIFQNLESPDRSISEGYFSLKSSGIIAITVLNKLFSQDKMEKIVQDKGFNIIKNWQLAVEDFALIAKKEKKLKNV